MRVDAGALVADGARVEVDAPVVFADGEVAVQERALARHRVRPQERVDRPAKRRLPPSVRAVNHVEAGGEIGRRQPLVVESVEAVDVEFADEEGVLVHGV